MLNTETNTVAMEQDVQSAFVHHAYHRAHRRVQTDFEHGQWWVTCLDCGMQFSVVDTDKSFDFENVTGSDELLCEET